MIKNLYLKNFALISELSINFENGLNIITGESGSGKSLIFKSINFLLGDRFQRENIKKNEKQCVIEGEFQTDEPIFIRRVFNSNGQSRNFVNDCPVNLDELKKVTYSFLDYHGQHDNQRLFSSNTHLECLDIFAGNTKLLKTASEEFRHIKDLNSEFEKLNKQNVVLIEKQELLSFQLEEIERYPYSSNSDEKISQKILKFSNIQTLIDDLHFCSKLLIDDDDSVRSKLISINKHLENLTKIEPELKNLFDRIQSQLLEIEDVGLELENQRKIESPNSSELESLNENLAHLEMLKRKYGGSLDSVLDTKNKIVADLSQIKFNSKKLNNVQSEIKKRNSKFNQLAEKLSVIRKNVKSEFESSIKNNFDKLGMENTNFKVHLTNVTDMKATGIDKCEFFISSSKKEELKPMGKIVSGGELARIQLAIKMVLGKLDPVDTLILDEIDTGISGRIAEFTGDVIKKLSNHKQIICITHLPQIAGKGHVHFKSKKIDINGQTVIEIDRLNKNSRVDEIASLISGKKITQAGKVRAKEILEIN